MASLKGIPLKTFYFFCAKRKKYARKGLLKRCTPQHSEALWAKKAQKTPFAPSVFTPFRTFPEKDGYKGQKRPFFRLF